MPEPTPTPTPPSPEPPVSTPSVTPPEPTPTPPVIPPESAPTPPATPPVDPPASPVTPAPEPEPKGDMKAGDYKVPEGWPKELTEMAAKGKLSQEQLEGSVNYFSGFLKEQKEAALTQLKEAGAKYMENWGEEKEQNVQNTKRAIEYINVQMGDNGFVKYLNQSNQSHHPKMIQALHIVSNLLQEGSFIPSNINRTKGKGKTLAQVMYGDKHPSKGD